MQPAETRMIFIVGANVRLMEWAALSLFRAGHIPVLGQWFWPLVTSDMAPADIDPRAFLAFAQAIAKSINLPLMPKGTAQPVPQIENEKRVKLGMRR